MGLLFTGSTPEDAATQAAPASKAEVSPLPDDPEVLKLAALAGRTTEARLKVEALLAAGATDEELAAWLAPLLVANPDWLETFILTVPENRRIILVRAAFLTVGELHPDSVWELIRRSPFAATAARKNDGTPQFKGLDLLWRFADSDLAAEVIFDPALGFTDAEAARLFSTGGGHPSSTPRILEEWKNGRWTGATPDCVRSAWFSLHRRDPGLLEELEKSMPASLQSSVENFRARARMRARNPEGLITSDPSADELRIIGAAEVKNLVEGRAWAGRPVPLATLAQLPPEVRGPALDSYFQRLYPFAEESAAQAVAALDDLDLTAAERQSLLLSAARQECNERGNYTTALEWAARMPDAPARAKFEQETWEKWARQDPEAALSHATTLPDGELKLRVEKLAIESKP